MASIIAGGFDVVTDADGAVARLREAGVRTDDLCTFSVNPAGLHDPDPAGEASAPDEMKKAGTKSAGRGAGTGAAIGAAAGLAAGAAAAPLMGPAGLAAGVAAGAYAGSLAGALRGTDQDPQPAHDSVRPAETLIAVNVDSGRPSAAEVVRIFEECNARQVEQQQGRWENGAWADFNPMAPPRLIGGRDLREARGAPPPR